MRSNVVSPELTLIPLLWTNSAQSGTVVNLSALTTGIMVKYGIRDKPEGLINLKMPDTRECGTASGFRIYNRASTGAINGYFFIRRRPRRRF